MRLFLLLSFAPRFVRLFYLALWRIWSDMNPSKDDLEQGYTLVPQPPLDKSNNQSQLTGKMIPVGDDVVKQSD